MESSKYTTISESFRKEENLIKHTIKKLSEDKEDDLGHSSYHSGRIEKTNIKNIVKICKTRNNNQMAAEMNNIGLEVRRIVGDPRHKRSYQYSCNTIEKTK